jgi:curved DNA-binding protein CbpA
MAVDFYAVLGVPKTATSEQVKQRFLQLTREKHPDRFTGSEKPQAELAFQAITQAFNVLSNPDRRRAHDMELQRGAEAAQGSNNVETAKAYLQRGVKAFKARNFSEAADAFSRATEADPNSAMAWHHLARTCLQNEKWLPRAAGAIARACELEPMKAEYAKLAGQIFAKSGEKEKAANFYRQAIRWGGDDPEIRSALEALEGGAKKKTLLGGLFGGS